MIEEIPGVDIYPPGDPWHLSGDVNKAIATYMYTVLTGDCALAGEPEPTESIAWRTWMAHKIGYLTAWNVMHMQGFSPCYGSILSIENKHMEEKEFTAYPNPTEGYCTIDLNNFYSNVTVTLVNLIGHQVFQEIFENKQQIDLTIDQPSGLYFVIIEIEGEQSVMKLVKN